MPCIYELIFLCALLILLSIAGYFLYRTAKDLDTYLIPPADAEITFGNEATTNDYPPKTIFAFGAYYVLKERA